MVVQKVPFKTQVVNMRKAEWRIGNTQKNGMAVLLLRSCGIISLRAEFERRPLFIGLKHNG